jgi:hypothetical protein
MFFCFVPLGEGGKSGNCVRGRHHPDNVRNTKLLWLKMIKTHMRLPPKREIWFWCVLARATHWLPDPN